MQTESVVAMRPALRSVIPWSWTARFAVLKISFNRRFTGVAGIGLLKNLDRRLDRHAAGHFAIVLAADAVGHDHDGAAPQPLGVVRRLPEVEVILVFRRTGPASDSETQLSSMRA